VPPLPSQYRPFAHRTILQNPVAEHESQEYARPMTPHNTSNTEPNTCEARTRFPNWLEQERALSATPTVMSPNQVNPAKFPNPLVIYNDDEEEFSIAWGSYEGGSKRLGMRWNGGRNETGYPNRGKYPVWFMLPDDLSILVIKGLLSAASADRKALNQKAFLHVLKELRAEGALEA
jgi:hypothetical protein